MNDAPPDDGSGYVAAAYLVFLALVLVYVVIMAYKLTRLDRDLTELNELADRQAAREHQDEERTPA
jgi:hypothetical protein